MSEHMGRERSNCFRNVGIEATRQTVAIPCEGAAKDAGNVLNASPFSAEFLERPAAGSLEMGPAA